MSPAASAVSKFLIAFFHNTFDNTVAFGLALGHTHIFLCGIFDWHTVFQVALLNSQSFIARAAIFGKPKGSVLKYVY